MLRVSVRRTDGAFVPPTHAVNVRRGTALRRHLQPGPAATPTPQTPTLGLVDGGGRRSRLPVLKASTPRRWCLELLRPRRWIRYGRIQGHVLRGMHCRSTCDIIPPSQDVTALLSFRVRTFCALIYSFFLWTLQYIFSPTSSFFCWRWHIRPNSFFR